MKERPKWLVYVMLVFATSMWGSGFIAGKIAVEDFGPFTVAFLRFFFAAVLLFPLMWKMEPKRPVVTLRDWLFFALLGLTGIFIYNVCFFLASMYAPVVKSSLFIATNPVLILLLSILFLKERVTRFQIAGMILALSGAATIISEGNMGAIITGGLEAIDIILLLAVVTWALYSVLGKVVLKKFSPVVSTTYAVMFGTIFLLPFSLYEASPLSWLEASPSSWLAILHMSVFVTVISFVMYYDGIQQIGASKAALFINVMPVSAVVMAVIFLNESFGMIHLAGALLVFSGVTLGTKVIGPQVKPVPFFRKKAG